MNKKPVLYSGGSLYPRIITLREQKVILDADLARIYGVPTKVLNQAVKRNREKFPADFIFLLTREETRGVGCLRSQTVTLKRGQHIKYLPCAFTEHGALMAAMVLSSPRAVQMSVFVVRAFIRMREQLLDRAELAKRLSDIEKTLMAHNGVLRDLYQKIRPLLLPPTAPPRRQIGFSAREARAAYRARRKKPHR
jgi:hypothetical protein